jgi:hypothetical protein
VVGAAPEVLARPSPDLVDAVVAGQRPHRDRCWRPRPRPATSRRGPAITPASIASRMSMSRKCSSPITRIVVVPAGEVRSQVGGRRERLGHRPTAELAKLIAEPRHDRRVAVTVDEPGITNRLSDREARTRRRRRDDRRDRPR